MKFEPGMKVVRINEHFGEDFKVGDIATVVQVSENGNNVWVTNDKIKQFYERYPNINKNTPQDCFGNMPVNLRPYSKLNKVLE